jgi:hypothetical protein
MDRLQKETLLSMILLVGGSAMGVALFLACVARYDYGLSGEEIRKWAIAGAISIASLLAGRYFGQRLRRR